MPSAALLKEHLFPKLRGQLAEFLNNPSPVGILESSSSYLPVSVCGTGSIFYSHSFLAFFQIHFPLILQSLTTRGNHRPAEPFKSVPVFKLIEAGGISTVCASATPSTRLSSRLTRSGRTFPSETLDFYHYDSHIILATHSGILTCVKSTTAFSL